MGACQPGGDGYYLHQRGGGIAARKPSGTLTQPRVADFAGIHSQAVERLPGRFLSPTKSISNFALGFPVTDGKHLTFFEIAGLIAPDSYHSQASGNPV